MEIPNEKPPPLPPQSSPPQLALRAAPHLLHLCEMDSLMPSPSRSLETGYESPIRTLGEQDFTGTPTYVKAPKVTQKTFASAIGSQSPLGAWAKPLKPPPLIPSAPHATGENLLPSNSHWPSLSASKQPRSRHSQSPSMVLQSAPPAATSPQVIHEDSDPTLVAQKNRFPWAARLSPSVRNLFQATTPIYMDDGTPKVQIPSHVLLQGLENQKEYVVGHFYRCLTPAGGLINAVVNRIWGRNCRIFTRKLGESSFLFHIPDASTRLWILQRGLWHVDDCLMFVAPWTPTASLDLPDISTVPVWVTLKNIPCQLYSISGISWIASGLGAPMLTNKPRLDPTSMGEAKILVEVELHKPFPQKVAAEDTNGAIYIVDVDYSWIPSKCERCGQLGHKVSRCLNLPHQSHPIGSKSTKVGSPSGSPVIATVSRKVPIPIVEGMSSQIGVTLPASDPCFSAETNSDVVPITEVTLTSSPSTTTTAMIDSAALPAYVSDVTPPESVSNIGIDLDSASTSVSVPVMVVATASDTTTIQNNDSGPFTVDASLESIKTIVVEPIDPITSAMPQSIPFSDSTVIPVSEVILPSIETTEVDSASLGNLLPPLPLDFEAPTLVSGNDNVCGTMENNVIDLGNRFARLEQGESVPMSEQDPIMTPSIHMTLRDRPVKPSPKVHDEWISVSTRGRRGRRGRGGRGNTN